MPQFISLTDRNNGNKPVYLAVEHIVSLQPISGDTWIRTDAHNKADNTGVYVVSESPETILALIAK